MAIISPEHQWPPPYPHPEGEQFARQEVYDPTRELLFDLRPKFKSTIRKTSYKHLALKIVDCPDADGRHRDLDRFILEHGVNHPVHRRRRNPLLLTPVDYSLDILNNLEQPDATIIASRLCYDYAAKAWATELLAKEVQERLEEEQDEEPWAAAAEWQDRHRDEETDDRILSVADPAFVEFLEQQTRLRELYRAIVTGMLDENIIDMDF